jgi:hypothetical protein
MGEVPEWPNGTVSKTVVGLVPTVGSNPTLSAAYQTYLALIRTERGFIYLFYFCR